MPKIETKITIAAPPATVRTIILNFSSYPQWNPFITSAVPSTEAAPPGSPIKVTIAKFIHQNATIEQNDASEFSWLSIIGGKWLFNALHEIKFEEDRLEGGEVGCKLLQSEKLGGLIGGLSFIYGGWMKRGFEKMNKALKQKAQAEAEDVDGA